MKFQSLKIEKMTYGENKGKLIAEISIKSEKSKISMELPSETGDKILALAKEAIINAVEESANDFIFELTTEIPDNMQLAIEG